MGNSLLTHIIKELKSYNTQVLIIENNDGFLFRKDVIEEFENNQIVVSIGNSITQRVSYELIEEHETLFLINKENRSYLEDIEHKCRRIDFFLDDFLNGYHIPTILKLPLKTLNSLYNTKQLKHLSKSATERVIAKLGNEEPAFNSPFNTKEFEDSLDIILKSNKIDWKAVSFICSEAISSCIGENSFSSVMKKVTEINTRFQEHIEKDYNHLKNSSSIKGPKIVSKVLDYIDFNFKEERVALIVIDGLSTWQYNLISPKLPGLKNENISYSWIPSITQLSRQAIFRGSNPINSYRQNPKSEERLWKDYWVKKKFNDFEIDYQYDKVNFANLKSIKRLAIVYKDLDDYMHSSKDYKDLLNLTENWLERKEIQKVITKLLSENFKIFITSDHGNIQAKGWRGLSGIEKLGTNKSGSRSTRHIEYSENWLKDEFIANNPEIIKNIVMKDRSIYFKNDQSFSREETLVTHGGAHFLEVVVPFIEITNE